MHTAAKEATASYGNPVFSKGDATRWADKEAAGKAAKDAHTCTDSHSSRDEHWRGQAKTSTQVKLGAGNAKAARSSEPEVAWTVVAATA